MTSPTFPQRCFSSEMDILWWDIHPQCTGPVIAFDNRVTNSVDLEITYAAHTASCTFLLDADGICRRIVVAPHVKRRESRTAARCVGAQYVASLDQAVAGGLVEMPRAGATMLFARVDERGRVSLVRTGTVTRFEANAGPSPFDSVSVKTSAPEITARGKAPPPPPPPIDDDYLAMEDEATIPLPPRDPRTPMTPNGPRGARGGEEPPRTQYVIPAPPNAITAEYDAASSEVRSTGAR